MLFGQIPKYVVIKDGTQRFLKCITVLKANTPKVILTIRKASVYFIT